MTRRDFGKPAFSLRKKRFVKTHALSLLGTTRLLSRSECGEGKCGANKMKMKEGGCSGAAAEEKMKEGGCSDKMKEGGCSGKM
jgi:hypothetical protein